MTEASPVRGDLLAEFATAALGKAGLPADQARLAADSLGQADLWDISRMASCGSPGIWPV